jgi:hypothetical protein
LFSVNLEDAVWISVLILGFGSEYVMGKIVTKYFSTADVILFWRGAQFAFPLCITIALVSHSFWGLLVLVFGLWKCGSPETLVFFSLACNRHKRGVVRLQYACECLGTLLHHSASTLLIVSVTTGREFLDRNLLSVTMPLVVQHWFVLLKYVDMNLYYTLELCVEAVWEWVMLHNLTQYPCVSWNGRLVGWAMLSAHWLYLFAAAVKVLTPSRRLKKKTDSALNKIDNGVVLNVAEGASGAAQLADGHSFPSTQKRIVSRSLSRGKQSGPDRAIVGRVIGTLIGTARRLVTGIASYERSTEDDRNIYAQWVAGMNEYEGEALCVRVLLRSAEGLLAGDINGTAQPYVCLRMLMPDGNNVHLIGKPCMSRVVVDSLSPEWNEKLELVGPAAEMDGAMISVEVFDRDLLSLDDPLGSAVVDISAAIPGDAEAVEFSAPLDTQGTVKFAVTTSRTHVARSGHLS